MQQIMPGKNQVSTGFEPMSFATRWRPPATELHVQVKALKLGKYKLTRANATKAFCSQRQHLRPVSRGSQSAHNYNYNYSNAIIKTRLKIYSNHTNF